MHYFIIALILLFAVLVSAVINQLFPKIALPLVQAAIGIVAAFVFPRISSLVLDPDLFLVLFIAPLLFLEAKNADLKMLVREIKPIISLAVVLVVVSMLALGFVLNFFIPTIVIASAVALGAALGPTDAVAVSSLSKTIKLPKWEHSILEGEMLFNDASGIVGFQVAILVATTGVFSLREALGDFALEFFGGIVVGLILGFCLRWVADKTAEISNENVTFFVLYEVFCPFIIYLISTVIGVSGIIAVVVAGLFKIIDTYKFGTNRARLVNATNSIWDVISFALNGMVFVLLGTQLPQIATSSWSDAGLDSLFLVGVILALTFIMFFLRFLWILAMEYFHFRNASEFSIPQDERNLSLTRRALIASLSGAKGAVTLSIMFTLPVTGLENRELLILIASGVILASLLVSIFVVPLVCPKKTPATESEEELHIVRQSADILHTAAKMTMNKYFESDQVVSSEALAATIKAMNKHAEMLDSDTNVISRVKQCEYYFKAIEWETECFESLKNGDASNTPLSPEAATFVSETIAIREALYEKLLSSAEKKIFEDHFIKIKKGVKLQRKVKSAKENEEVAAESRAALMTIYNYVIEHLTSIDDDSREMQHTITSYHCLLAQLSRPADEIRPEEEDRSWAILSRWALVSILDETDKRIADGIISKTQAHAITQELSALVADISG